MDDKTLLILLIVLAGACLLLLVLLLLRRRGGEADRAVVGLKDELRAVRTQTEKLQSLSRQETLSQLQNMSQLSLAAISQIAAGTERDLAAMRHALGQQLSELRGENEKSLSAMRRTVEDNLTRSVADGLKGSFASVSAQLSQVSASVGEMRSLTADVADLKRILAGVKTRGNWGELQLEALIGDMLAPGQYEAQLALSPGGERVDFAVCLPGDGETPVYLPIDAKFPMDRYRAVLDAEEFGDDQARALARETLLRSVQGEAKKIAAKYILPPVTTDFAVLFVPSEGLYGELAAQGQIEALQRQHRVLLAGPSSLSALLSSLLLGFKTLAFEQRSGEILKVLEEVRRSFGVLQDQLLSLERSLHGAQTHLSRALSSGRRAGRLLEDLKDEGPADPPPPEEER